LNFKKTRRIARKIFQFENSLVSSKKPNNSNIDTNYQILSRQDLVRLLGSFNGNDYLENNLSLRFDSIFVSDTNYIKKISELFKNETLESWKYFISFSYIKTFANYSSIRISKLLNPDIKNIPIKHLATQDINDKLIGKILGNEFVKKYHTDETNNKIQEIVGNLINVFESRINNSEWLSAVTKPKAINKLKSIDIEIGLKDESIDFSELQLDSVNLISNVKKINVLSYKNNIQDIGQINDTKFEFQAHTVGAYYDKYRNKISIPAGILQKPFYDENYEDAFIYASVGSIIGHELSHAFDIVGSEFDGKGSLKNWWTKNDKLNFIHKCNAFGETYSKFCPFKDYCLDTRLTLRENISDMDGLVIAYEAYKKTEEFFSDKKINGYSPAQRFFIAYAQCKKGIYTKNGLKNQLIENPHSPWEYRVNGTLKNFIEFHKAFEVKETEPMSNPKNQIINIW
jgi:putative endopeptidase